MLSLDGRATPVDCSQKKEISGVSTLHSGVLNRSRFISIVAVILYD